MAKFANMNLHPVILPGRTGGSFYFRPGESTSDAWFSRFPDLTKVPDDWTAPKRPRQRLGAPVRSLIQNNSSNHIEGRPRPPACSSSCQIVCEADCQSACESGKQTIIVHDTVEQIGNKFYCRFCDWDTTNKKQVDTHMAAYHAKEVKARKRTVKVQENSRPGKIGEPEQASGRGVESPAVPAASTSAVPQQAPQSSRVEEEETEFYVKKNGLYFCKTCESWKTQYKTSMVRHCKRYHGAKSE